MIHLEDEYFMREALKEAEEAYAAREVPVGVVVVSNNRIISWANNQVDPLQDATTHAEILAGCTVFTISCCGLLVCVYITFLPLVGMLSSWPLLFHEKFIYPERPLVVYKSHTAPSVHTSKVL